MPFPLSFDWEVSKRNLHNRISLWKGIRPCKRCNGGAVSLTLFLREDKAERRLFLPPDLPGRGCVFYVLFMEFSVEDSNQTADGVTETFVKNGLYDLSRKDRIHSSLFFILKFLPEKLL